jgi:DNA modification methylase
MTEQQKLGIKEEKKLSSVEEYKFEPIKGYPMLHWKGKRPFTCTQFYPAQLKENHGEEVNGWMNKIFWGDNLQVMSHLLKEYRGQVDLIYIDPPYDSKADYKKKIELKGQLVLNDRSSFEEKQYTDIWSNDEYLQFMFERLVLMRELLSDSGAIFLHCDWHKNHQLRCILDEIFGIDNFRNEIIWYYADKFATGGKSLDKNHDVIYHYSKTSDFTGNDIMIEKDKPSKRALRKKIDGKTTDVIGPDGKKIIVEYSEKRIDDVWQLSKTIPSNQLFYPTQKKETVLERIILYGSNKGNLIFDCFMGSGTTQAVALKHGRRFIGADINLGAVQTTTKRLIQIADDLKQKRNNYDSKATQLTLVGEEGMSFAAEEEVSYGKDNLENLYSGFSVYNVNHYDVFRNPLEAKDILIKALEIQPLPNNSIYDGEKDGRMVKIMPINRIATRADLNELVTNFDYKKFEKANEASPNKAVELLLLVCMGHEPDLAAELQSAVPGYKLDIEVVDILRDKSNLEFKRDAEAEIVIEGGKLLIREFFPMNLLQKLSLMKENVENWKELVDSVMVDFNYDGAVFEPQIVDVPEGDELVKGVYDIPANAGTIRVKITDLLSESLEQTVTNG